MILYVLVLKCVSEIGHDCHCLCCLELGESDNWTMAFRRALRERRDVVYNEGLLEDLRDSSELLDDIARYEAEKELNRHQNI